MHRLKKTGVCAAVLGLVLGASACGGGAKPAAQSTTSDWDQVIAEAKKEGTVVWDEPYSNHDLAAAVAKPFEDKYGIKVQILELSPADAQTRLGAEARRPQGSIDVEVSALSSMHVLDNMKVFAPPGNLPDVGRLEKDFPVEGNSVPVALSVWGILINTDKVKDDGISCWNDLTKPEYAGKISMGDPTVGVTASWFALALRTLGRPYLDQIAGQKPVFSGSAQQAVRDVTSGNLSAYFPLGIYQQSTLAGQPAKIVWPCEGAQYLESSGAIVTNAPHPNAGRLFLNYMLSDEAQSVLAATGGYRSPTGIVPGSAPGKLWGTASDEERTAAIPTAKQVFNR